MFFFFFLNEKNPLKIHQLPGEARNTKAGDVPRQTPLPAALGKLRFQLCNLHPSLQHRHRTRGPTAGQIDLLEPAKAEELQH